MKCFVFIVWMFLPISLMAETSFIHFLDCQAPDHIFDIQLTLDRKKPRQLPSVDIGSIEKLYYRSAVRCDEQAYEPQLNLLKSTLDKSWASKFLDSITLHHKLYGKVHLRLSDTRRPDPDAPSGWSSGNDFFLGFRIRGPIK
ncbi:MAG: hypothetical protein JWQ35_1748 [Bacteriovoracaceae bacterium]|nr:hypothetical protein [Bacteriovoracaceae bacterium]